MVQYGGHHHIVVADVRAHTVCFFLDGTPIPPHQLASFNFAPGRHGDGSMAGQLLHAMMAASDRDRTSVYPPDLGRRSRARACGQGAAGSPARAPDPWGSAADTTVVVVVLGPG